MRSGISKLDGGSRRWSTPRRPAPPRRSTPSVRRSGGAARTSAIVYLQLALYLAPNHALALTSLADIYEGMRKPELAIKTYERVASTSPLSHNARIQRALNLDQIDRTDEAIADLERIVEANASDREAIMALGNILRARKKFAECANVYSKAIDSISQDGKVRLGGLLFPRHLLRAIQAVAEGRSRHEDGARAVAGPAARAQLSRLFMGGSGPPSRRGHAHDPPRRRAARRRRLHRRFARLGLLTGWATSKTP